MGVYRNSRSTCRGETLLHINPVLRLGVVALRESRRAEVGLARQILPSLTMIDLDIRLGL